MHCIYSNVMFVEKLHPLLIIYAKDKLVSEHELGMCIHVYGMPQTIPFFSWRTQEGILPDRLIRMHGLWRPQIDEHRSKGNCISMQDKENKFNFTGFKIAMLRFTHYLGSLLYAFWILGMRDMWSRKEV